jgi:hypothetical protein
VVERYVRETRSWPKDSYFIELNRREGDTLIFWVIHREAAAAAIRSNVVGSDGKSFALYIDARALQVLRELGFQ